MDHDRAVQKHYLAAANSLENGYWDVVLREYSYFEGDRVPFGDHPEHRGNELGDLDVALVNINDRTLYVKEIKTGYGDLGYAQDQLDRVEDHFGQFGWDVIKRKVLER